MMRFFKSQRSAASQMRRPAAFVLLALTLGLFIAAPAQAFRLTPIVQDFQPAGRGAVQNFLITNTTPERIAVEIKMAKRSIAVDGTETLTPEQNDFVVFPAQIALEPGKNQTIQVRWIGEPDPKAELAYRIIAEQLPVELDRSRQDIASIRLLIKYEGSVYVAPKGVKPHVGLDSLRHVTTKDGKAGLEVNLANKGNAHGILRSAELTVTDAKGGSVTLKGDAAKAMENINILAGGSRRIVLPWPAALTSQEVKGKLTAKVER